MPTKAYTEKLKVYECLQYDGTNYEELAAFAPVVQEGEQVYLVDPHVGNMALPVGYWVMRDIFGYYQPLSDELFQKGYKPGGGPV